MTHVPGQIHSARSTSMVSVSKELSTLSPDARAAACRSLLHLRTAAIAKAEEGRRRAPGTTAEDATGPRGSHGRTRRSGRGSAALSGCVESTLKYTTHK